MLQRTILLRNSFLRYTTDIITADGNKSKNGLAFQSVLLVKEKEEDEKRADIRRNRREI